ncbi:MAG: TssA family type VI secretion system protein [Candidatus Thiodiazotropha sp. (ex Monitilora ramsayi)]|nr:TssA family type VI secretion system protein [Candidatus Thiodiazotropha sp. (ex Monitilora ramsayi)]
MEGALQTKTDSAAASPLDELMLPIGDNGAGEDPRYGDDFNAVKLEIDRLSDTDYAEVVRLCKRILQEESKDLRVAGYFLMAKIFTEGFNGLIEGTQLYHDLIKRYGLDCHPQREIAKLQAIGWLNNEKLAAFVKKISLENDSERAAISGLKALIESLNSEIISLHGSEAMTWTSLNPWVEKNQPSDPEVPVAVSDNAVETLQMVPADVMEITSELSFTRTAEDLLSYLVKSGDWQRLVAMSRALKWSSMILPANENGRTKIQPPREQIIIETQASVESDISVEKLAELESCFMETGSQFYFDLQKQEVEVANTVGRRDIAKLIEEYLRQLVDREPGLLHLTYSDGTPFASEPTRRWISNMKTEQKSDTDCRSDESDLQVRLNELVGQVGSSDLISVIDKMGQIEPRDQSEAFRIGLTKVDLCINAGRGDLALPLAEHLEILVEKYRLQEWHQPLALSLWDKLLVILQNSSDETPAVRKRIEELKGKICTTDLGFALRAF